MLTDAEAPGPLTRGRAAFAEHRWQDAFRDLAAADAVRSLADADLEALGRSASMTGRDAEAFEVLERVYTMALTVDDPLRAAEAAFWCGFRLASLGERGRADAWLARSARLAEKYGDCAVVGYLLLPTVHRKLSRGDAPGAHSAAMEAFAIGERFRETDLCALALQLAGRVLIEQGDVVGGVQLLDEAMLIATTEPVTELVRGLVYCAVIGSCSSVFLVDRAREWSDVLDAWCKSQVQLGIFSGTCRVHRAELMRIGGAWSDAMTEASLVRSTANVPEIDRAAASYEEAEIYRLRGQTAQAELAYARASEFGANPQPGLALLRLGQGDIEAAAGAIRRSVDGARTPLGRARCLPAHIEIMLAAGDRAEASAAALDLSDIAATFGTPVLLAMAAHARGLVALADADAHTAIAELGEALQIWLALPAPYAAAQVRVALSEAYLALGDTDGARLEHEAAQRVFASLDARADLDPLDPPVDPTSGPLSERELQVLRLVAAGETNRAIGSELGLSMRTVDRHMSNILTKLAVPSRAAATAYAYENGLIQL
jgi:DNA-binding CsgD family transcriptional regulator